MKTRMTRKENRRLSLLVAGTLGMTVAFGFAPPWRADVLGVEIGASVAHAEEVTDVSTWENARKSYGSNQTVKVMNGDTELAAFTTNANVTLSYTPSSGDGTNGSITVDTWAKNCFRDATIYANTKLIWNGCNGERPTFTAKLSGGGASFSGGSATVKLAADSTADATIDFGRWVTDSDGWPITFNILTGTDGTKLSAVGGGFLLCGTVDVSEASGIGDEAHVGANATVKTAQVTIHGSSQFDSFSVFYIKDNTTTMTGGTFGDIEATGTGKVIFGSTNFGDYTLGNVTAGNVTADEVVGVNVKAKSIKANTVTASSITADSITTDTLSVLKQKTAEMVNLNVDTIDASTVVLADGAIVNGKDGSSAANIKADTLQVDSQIAAAGIKNANVTAKTPGKQVSIVGRTGRKIPKQDMEDIAKAANMKEGTYTSATTEAAKKTVTKMLDSADQLGTEGTPATKLEDGDDALEYEHTYTSTTDAGTATVAKTGTVTSEGDKPVLNLKTQNYTYDLSADAKDKDTFLTSTNTGTTTIDGKDVTVEADNKKMLSLNKGESVTLLKDEAGTLEYDDSTGTSTFDHTYTTTNANNGTATVATAGKVQQAGNNLVLNIDAQHYAFGISPATKDQDTFLTSTNTGATKINSDDVTLDDSALAGKLLSLSKGDNVYLLKDRTGTLTYTEGTNVPKLAHTYTNTTDAGTATVTTAGSVSKKNNDLVLNIDDQKYTFDLSSGAKDKDTFLTSTNTGTTKIDSTDMTFDTSATTGNMLSLSKGDTVYLLKNDTTGTLAYDDAKKTHELNHEYKPAASDAGAATITTHAKVKARDNDLVLDVDAQNYTFDVTPATKNQDVYLTSTNTGTTKIDAADVIVNDKAVGKILSLNNGDTVYLLKNGTGKLVYTNDSAKEVGLNHKYLNGEKTASIATSATVEQSGNDLVLNVGGVKYFFQLSPDIRDGYTYLDSENTAMTELDGSELGFEDDTSKMLSLNKGETVTLLKKENAGTLTYTGAKTLDRTYTNKTDAGTAAVRTTGTVAQDGDALKLNIDGVTYTFDLSAGARNKDALLTSENTGETKIDGADITLNDEALDGSVLALNKGDKVYLLKNDKGTLTYDDADSKIVREYTYTNAAGDASIVTDATVQADGSDLVLNVDGVTYTYKLTAATKDGDTFIASSLAA